MAKKNNVFVELDQAQKTRAEKITELERNLKKAEEDKSKAVKDANKALSADDLAAWSIAKDAGRAADDQIEFYKIQLEDLKSAPLFGNDYVAKIAEIKAAQNDLIDKYSDEVVQVMRKASEIMDDYFRELEKSNKALQLAYDHTGFTYTPTISLALVGVSKSINAVKNNPELSKYW